MGISKCKNCGETLDWCECKQECVNGSHFWKNDSEVCNFCGITKKEVEEGVTIL